MLISEYGALMQNNTEEILPIGVFDSGVGGLTVAHAIKALLPKEQIVYFGDIARLPYGTKSFATIKNFASESVEFLLKKQVKALVIACNTIAAVAYQDVLKLAPGIPIIDVISCGSVAGVQATRNQKIGVIATPATIKSRTYIDTIKALNPAIEVFAEPCALFVPFIEEGMISHPALEMIARDYVAPLLTKDIDTLILGCTHYPIIIDTLKKIVGDRVQIINPAFETANKLQAILKENNLLRVNSPEYALDQFYITAESQAFNNILQQFFGNKIIPELIY